MIFTEQPFHWKEWVKWFLTALAILVIPGAIAVLMALPFL